MFTWVKRASYLELALFASLIVVWLVPGYEGATSALGLAHGLGFVALALLIWVAVIRHEAPYTLLAATLTPVGPVGSVIAIHYIERRDPADGGAGRGKKGGAGPRRGSRGPPHARRPPYLTPMASLVPLRSEGKRATVRMHFPEPPGGGGSWRGGAAGGRGSTRPAPPPARR